MKKVIIIALIFAAYVFFRPSGENEKDEGVMIKMPYDSNEYSEGEWTKESLAEHFKELGFEEVEARGYVSTDKTYFKDIFGVSIGGRDEWAAGDELNSSKRVEIQYNGRPPLTVDNCPDLVTVLTSKNIDYMDFANKYDGRYIIIDGYVDNYISFSGGTSHVIEIKGESEGLTINIDDHYYFDDIDYSIEEGTNVRVEGKVSAEWSNYYKRLTIQTLVLKKTGE